MTEIFARIGGIAILTFVVFLFLAIKSKKKGSPTARKQFNTAWISLAVVVLMAILNPKPTTQTAQIINTEETAKAESSQVETTATKPIENASQSVSETNAEESISTKETEVVEKQAPSIPGTIGMTPTEFRKAFNKHSSELGTDLTITHINVIKGSVQDTFTHNFSNDLVLLGSVNKVDGSLRELSLITQAKTPTSAEDFLIVFGMITLATNPDSDPNAAKIVGEKLGIFKDGVDFATLDTSTVYDGIEYKMKAYEGMGFMLFVRDPKDK